MDQHQLQLEEKPENDRIHISFKNESHDPENGDFHELSSPQNYCSTPEQIMIRNKENFLLEIPEKRQKVERVKFNTSGEPIEHRRPSMTMNLNYKYSPNQNNTPKVKSVIEYIEGTINLSKKDSGPLPSVPRKQFALSLCLMISGIICIMIGTGSAIASGSSQGSIALWSIGALCGLPGTFYTIKFFRAYYAKTADSRKKVLAEIPRG